MRFYEPAGYELRVAGLKEGRPRARLYQDDKPLPEAQPEVAVGPICEIAVRLCDLSAKPNDPLHFAVEATTKKSSLDRAPREGAIELRCPTPDFELLNWQV